MPQFYTPRRTLQPFTVQMWVFKKFENAVRNVLISFFKPFKRKMKNRRIDYDTLFKWLISLHVHIIMLHVDIKK